jgi:DNA-binding NtrC family response regulator
MPGKILIVDYSPANIRMLSESLEREGHEILVAADAESGLHIAGLAKPALILLDIMMPGQDGLSICRELKNNERTSQIPIIFITAKQETESLLIGFRAGAVDYIQKPFSIEEVLARIATHLQIGRLTRELLARNQELELAIARREEAEEARRNADERLSRLSAHEELRWGLAGFIGQSRTLQKILKEIERLNRFSNTSVLVQAESGTGKELVARAIHHQSPRAAAPFVAVNCVAIPVELAESMLFGHVRGAFTGATGDRKGWFEVANGGTMFLDEIGDMPSLQGKLLRVLEDHQIVPVGGCRPISIDVRIIAATNAELSDKIQRGAFRQDLFFRLARYIVTMPPLREPRDDIPLLVEHFLRLFAAEMGMISSALEPAALELLLAYSFPGNVRELKNVIERALIESSGSTIQARHRQIYETSEPEFLCNV